MSFMKKKNFLMTLKPTNGNRFDPENYKSKNFSEEVVDTKTGKVVIKLGEKLILLMQKNYSTMV